MSDIYTARCTHRLCTLASDLRVWNTLFIPGVRVFGMLNNEYYMSGVGTQQFQAFPPPLPLFNSTFHRWLLWNLEFNLTVDSHSKNQTFGMSHCVPGAALAPQRHFLTTHKTWLFSNTAVGTSNHGLLSVYVCSFVSFLCSY